MRQWLVCLLLFTAVIAPPLAAAAGGEALLRVRFHGLTCRLHRSAAGHLELRVTHSALLNPQIFLIEDPWRLVIDLPGLKTARTERFAVSDDLVHGLRAGTHPDKLRLVLDLGDAVEFDWHIEAGVLRAKLRPAAMPVTPATPETAQTPVRIPATMVPATPTPTRTATPAPTGQKPDPVDLLAARRLKRPVPTAGPEPTKAVSEPAARALLSFQFSRHPGTSAPVVKLVLNTRPEFSVLKRSAELWTIVNFNVEPRDTLALPHFPPQDFVGFTYLQGRKAGSDSEVLVGVEKDRKLLYFTKGSEIWLQLQE